MSKAPRAREGKIERASDLLEERFRPAALMLYGSRASGRARPASDFDVGMVIGGSRPDPFAVATAKIDLEELLGASVDLVVLDGASPVLRMEVLRNCKVLRRRDPEAFETFVVRTLGEYFDLKTVRAPIERALASGVRA